MTTLRLALAAVVAVAMLGFGDSRLHVVLPAALLVALLAVGELWLRALTAEAVAAACRIGLAVAAGLVTLPLAAIVLHALTVPVRARSMSVALGVLVLLLAAIVLVRERTGPVPADPRLVPTIGAITIPLLLALVVGGAATIAYARLPRPPAPGYTSVALGGWATRITRPVAFPAAGLVVPVIVSRAGEPAGVAPLVVQVGDRVGRARSVRLPVDGTSSVAVHVPAPPNACLHRIEISLGQVSITFYGRGPIRPPRSALPC